MEKTTMQAVIPRVKRVVWSRLRRKSSSRSSAA